MLVRAAVARHATLLIEDIDASLHLERDLELDPLDLILIAMRVSDIAEIDFPMHRLEAVATVGELVDTLRGSLPSSGAASHMPPVYARLARLARVARVDRRTRVRSRELVRISTQGKKSDARS